jgi:threonine/homoserine/homoserine lactone efflux protein
MLEYLLIGMGIAVSAGLQPGPLQAFFFASVAKNGWRRTVPAAFAPLISDGPIALVAILLLKNFPVGFRVYLQLAGGILLCYYAWGAFKNLGEDKEPERQGSTASPKTVLQAALVNLLNPNPYLGWSLIMGPSLIKAWGESPGYAITLLAAFYFNMISINILLIILMGTSELLDQQGKRILVLISGIILAGLGIYYLVSGGLTLTGSSVKYFGLINA